MADVVDYSGLVQQALRAGKKGANLYRNIATLPLTIAASLPAQARNLIEGAAAARQGEPINVAPYLGAALGAGATAFPFAEPGAAGIFGGRLAKTADLGALAAAQDAHKAGIDPMRIWDATGWFRGADGQWRFEIPDANLQMRTPASDFSAPPTKELLDNPPLTLAERMTHPELSAAYPWVGDIGYLGFLDRYAPRIWGATADTPSGLTIALNRSSPDLLGTMTHELQHAVQGYEGFSPGGSTMHPIVRQEAFRQGQEPFDIYQRLAGEAEARLAAMRRGMSTFERAFNPPFAATGGSAIPYEWQIVLPPEPFTTPTPRPTQLPLFPGM